MLIQSIDEDFIVQSISAQRIMKNDEALAVVKFDGSVVAWGHEKSGGDCSKVRDQIASGVQSLYRTNRAFASLKSDASVVACEARLLSCRSCSTGSSRLPPTLD